MRSFLIFLITACSFALYGEARAAESLVAFDESQVTPQTVSPDTSERVTGKPQSSYPRNPSGVSPNTSKADTETPHSEYYYNLGNISYNSGDLGRAILCYERSLHLDPRNRDARHNRDLAIRKTVDKISDGKSWFASAGETLAYALPLTALVPLALILFVGALASGIFFFLTESRGRRRLYFYLGLSLFGLCIFTNALILHWVYTDRAYRSIAVVLSPEVHVHISPEASSGVAFTLHEGARVQLTDEPLDGWQTITLPDGRKGWITSSSIEAVLPH